MNRNFALPDVSPPNHPWLPIDVKTNSLATISFYYGDSQAPVIPVRDVTNQNDAKRDPNLETLTYGLFSICCESERKSIVEKGIGTQFFCTTRANGTRVLTGYYHPKFYCEMEKTGDYAIAAKSGRFVSPGFILTHLGGFLNDESIGRFFRPWKYIRGQEKIEKLLLLINSAPDSTEKYLSEIKRLEAYAVKKYGLMYFDRTEGFSWKSAAQLMKKRGMI